jgi:hypothetical protein
MSLVSYAGLGMIFFEYTLLGLLIYDAIKSKSAIHVLYMWIILQLSISTALLVHNISNNYTHLIISRSVLIVALFGLLFLKIYYEATGKKIL